MTLKNIPWVPFIFLSSFIICCAPAKEEPKAIEEPRSDTTELIRNFIYGLWSMDSGNTLANQGFYFKNDGTVDFVSADASGNWEMGPDNNLIISYSTFRKENRVVYKLDSLDESRMILSDSDGVYVFRKVPFGINNEGNVAQGFSGSLSGGQEKEYFFDVTVAKKIALRLSCNDSSLTFRVFDGSHQLTAAGVRNWTGIIIRSGKYKMIVSKPKVGGFKGESEFDLKVLVY